MCMRELSRSGFPTLDLANHLLAAACFVRRRVGVSLIMSPTRNRNFVRRVPDKNEVHCRALPTPSVRLSVRGRVGKRGRSREDLELRTRERGTCYFDGYEAEARLYAVTHRSSRGSFRTRGSSPTAVGMGFLLRSLWPSLAFQKRSHSRISDIQTSYSRDYHCLLICVFVLITWLVLDDWMPSEFPCLE